MEASVWSHNAGSETVGKGKEGSLLPLPVARLVPSNAGPEQSNAKLQGEVDTIQQGFLNISL